jgi:hypothetical protein
MSGTRSRIRKAPATDRRNGGGTLVLVTHGIEGAPGSAAAHAAAIAALGRFEQVRVGCLKGRPGLAEALSGAPNPVCIVPLLMAEGFIHDLMRRRLAELPGCGAWRLAAPVGCHPGLTEAILAKAMAACWRQGWAMSCRSACNFGFLEVLCGCPWGVCSSGFRVRRDPGPEREADQSRPGHTSRA